MLSSMEVLAAADDAEGASDLLTKGFLLDRSDAGVMKSVSLMMQNPSF